MGRGVRKKRGHGFYKRTVCENMGKNLYTKIETGNFLYT